MDSVYIVAEQSGVGQLLQIIAVYKTEKAAEEHIGIARALMPQAANKLVKKEFDLREQWSW